MSRQNRTFLTGAALLGFGSYGLINPTSWIVIILAVVCSYYGAKKIIKANY